MLTVQEVRVDPETRRVWCRGEEVAFSNKEFDLLNALIVRAGDVVGRDELMLTVWQREPGEPSKTLDVHLGWVRRKLGEDGKNPRYITTLRGRGLRFETGGPRSGRTPAR